MISTQSFITTSGMVTSSGMVIVFTNLLILFTTLFLLLFVTVTVTSSVVVPGTKEKKQVARQVEILYSTLMFVTQKSSNKNRLNEQRQSNFDNTKIRQRRAF